MKITALSSQTKNPDRVNVSVDGSYRFSLDVSQLIELGIKVGSEYSDEQLIQFETESQFGKLYGRALEYCFLRPHSEREVRDYLWRKTRTAKYKTRKGDIKERPGVSQDVADRVLEKLKIKNYVDDEKFARWWVENRNQRKGSSIRKLTSELQAKGVERTIIEQVMRRSDRNDQDELLKMIAKKRQKYDEQKLIQYLARQGFRYDDIKTALTTEQID